VTSTETSAKGSFRSRDDIHVLAAVLAVTAWGIGPIFNKALSVSTSSIVFYRMLFGLPIMVLMAYMNGGSLNKHVIRKAALPGFMFAMSFITGFATVKMTSIANATMVGTLQPVLVLFVAPKLFGEKITLRKLGYSISAMAGVLVVVGVEEEGGVRAARAAGVAPGLLVELELERVVGALHADDDLGDEGPVVFSGRRRLVGDGRLLSEGGRSAEDDQQHEDP
jgi:hypothetical protein